MLYWIVGILAVLYLLVCSFFYFYQENLIFYPTRLSKDYQFTFQQSFQEHTIQMADGKSLHGILFKADRAKGLIFFLHGNAGALDSWGEIARTYTHMQYDIFIMDYRGFGKSEGKIISEQQFYSDVQAAYHYIKSSRYEEKDIIIIGFSIGSAAATMLAATNHPKMLILQAPYYSLTDLMQNISPFIYAVLPGFVFKYKFNTYAFARQTKTPVIIFHGDQDFVIYHESSHKLKQYLKTTDKVIILRGQGHYGINDNSDYILAFRELLPFAGKN